MNNCKKCENYNTDKCNDCYFFDGCEKFKYFQEKIIKKFNIKDLTKNFKFLRFENSGKCIIVKNLDNEILIIIDNVTENDKTMELLYITLENSKSMEGLSYELC